MNASYHNHTTWSDGRATVAETVAAARALGLDEVGVSDHWALDPTGWIPPWGMHPDRLGDYVADVRAVAASDGERPILRLGLEVDWFQETAAEIARRLAEHAFDFLIGSVHTVGDFRYDSSATDWDGLAPEARDDQHRLYWRTVAGMARSGLFDFVGHLDLPKKYRQYATADIGEEVDAALDALAAADMAVELNTAGWFKPCEDAYPSEDILRRCRLRDIPVLLSADAHRPTQLAREFERGAERLRAAGYREVARFDDRRRRMVGL